MMVWVRYLRNHHGARAGDVTTMRHDLAQSFVNAGLLEFHDPNQQQRLKQRVVVREVVRETIVREIHHHYHEAPSLPQSYRQPELQQGEDFQEVDRERRQRIELEKENARLRAMLDEKSTPRLAAPKSRRQLEPAEVIDAEFIEVEKDPSKR